MLKNEIPKEIQVEVIKIIDTFNEIHFKGRKVDIAYYPVFKGKDLLLNRMEFGKDSPVARLTYTENMNKWDFAIFRWTTEEYDPEEDFFPGVQFVDGTVEGAMKAGMAAYPV